MSFKRLKVRHETIYSYSQPVRFGEHMAMFRPRDSHDLRLLDAKITLSPQADVRWRHDVFGNSIAHMRFAAPSDQLRIVSEILIDHYGGGAPTLDVDAAAERLPFTYPSDELPDLGRTIERHYPDPQDEIGAWARGFLDTTKSGGTVAFFEALTLAIKERFTYEWREEVGVRPPLETLHLRSGACRDYALLMMEAARSVGVASRFVTGYVYDPAIDGAGEAAQGAGATHAWAQVYLPGAGWVEYDPTNGIIGNANLIRVGVARDPSQAVPLQGSFEGQPGDFLSMKVDVTVHSERPNAPESFRAA